MAIAPGKPGRSLLWVMVESDKMPLGGSLTAAQKQLLRTYIEQGRFPTAEMDAAQAAREAARITPEARRWWSFQVPVKPGVPAARRGATVRTPIDAFVDAKLAAKGWRMQPEAERVTLARRLYFGLTGVAPTPAEMEAFLADRTPQAYRAAGGVWLLESPRYGEHWGRHWLDIAGYSDTRGDAGIRCGRFPGSTGIT
jgi:hypothetical protein